MAKVQENESTLMKELLQNSDVFGGDSDSESEPSSSPQHKSTPSPTTPIVEEPKKKKRKQLPKEPKPKKLKKTEVYQIHSDSQRMVRESSLNLPKYQPKTKNLNSFLTRVRSRKPHSTPAVATIKTTPLVDEELEKGHQINKENSLGSDGDDTNTPSPVATEMDATPPDTDDDHASNNTAEDHVTSISDKPTVEVQLEEKVSESSTTVHNLPVKEVDLSYSEEPSSTTPGPIPCQKSATKSIKQTTITSLFSTKPSVGTDPIREKTPPPAPPSNKPQLTSIDNFLLERDEELTVELKLEKKITPLEEFQQRFTQHATSKSQSNKMRVKTESKGDELIPEEVVAKVGDKPGALRQHLMSMLRKQVYERRAEERRAAEEVRRMYDEDLDDEEEEREMTDGDTTSDEEFEVVKNDLAAVDDSDVCSDLDQQENITKAIEEASNEESVDEDNDSDSDVGVNQPTLVRKKLSTHRILDSDDSDYDNKMKPQSDHSRATLDTNSNSTAPKLHSSRSVPFPEYSMSMFDNATSSTTDPVLKETSRKESTSSLLSQEASMPPLMLTPSSDESSDNESVEQISTDPNFTFGLPRDSGVGTMVNKETDDSQLTLQSTTYESAGGSLEASLLGEKDSSLEMSFRWPDGSSLPPGQPFREDRETRTESGFSDTTFDPQSQCEEVQESVSMDTQDEATQYLDAEGFLCIRKKKRESRLSSAIRNSLDPTQNNSPSELLGLCSGRFEDSQDSTLPPPVTRHSSDSSSTQGMRELLGLNTKPKAIGISGLLSEEDNNTANNVFSQFNEMLGLCSGVFPTTQANGSWENTVATSQSIHGDEDSQNALFGWPEKQQREGDGYHGDSESGDEDMPVIKKKKRVKLKEKNNNRDRLAEFVESEAELSGSDVGEDEDDEILAEEEEGLYGYGKEEEGAQSDVPLSDTELWDQVNKAHMKHTLADDKADLRDIKERFLKEGDLYEDGLALKNGFFRSRRFAKESSEVGSVDLFSEEVGEGEEVDVALQGEELSSQAEARRRKERLEREEFMTKCRERDNSLLAMDEDSQSILSIIVDNSSQSATTTPLPGKSVPKLVTPTSSSGGYKNTKGSFLKHGSNTLRRLSSLTSATPKAGGGGANGFVFHKKPGAVGVEPVDGKTKAQPIKRAKRLLSEEKQMKTKRPKLDRSISAPSGTPKHFSIFSILNK